VVDTGINGRLIILVAYFDFVVVTISHPECGLGGSKCAITQVFGSIGLWFCSSSILCITGGTMLQVVTM